MVVLGEISPTKRPPDFRDQQKCFPNILILIGSSPPIIVAPNLYILVYNHRHGWCQLDAYALVFLQFNCTQEVADDRIMFHE